MVSATQPLAHLPSDVCDADLDLQTQILVVDDDAGIRSLTAEFLTTNGFQVATAADGDAMAAAMNTQQFDLVLLDIMMPGKDGLSILRGLDPASAPAVILMSVMGSDVDRIVGLEMGADDYLAKPFNPREMLARIRAVLRRRRATSNRATATVATAPICWRFDGYTLEPDARLLVGPDSKDIMLTDGEFQLLLTFVERPRRVLSRDALLDYARGENAEQFDRAIDVQISRLRKKLEHGGGEMIRTVRGEGYLFVPHVARG